jgi:curved DNA-binding protein CbpA
MSARAFTYYDVLRVDRTAGPADVRAAYRRLASQYHPDRLPDSREAHRLMAELNAAYAVLSNPRERARYDSQIDSFRESQMRMRAAFIARLEDNGARWPWVLLVATSFVAMTCIGVSLYSNQVPSAATTLVRLFQR